MKYLNKQQFESELDKFKEDDRAVVLIFCEGDIWSSTIRVIDGNLHFYDEFGGDYEYLPSNLRFLGGDEFIIIRNKDDLK